MVGQYKARIVDTQLQRRLEGIGAVLIEGPKLCGKTTTAEQIAESVLYMALPEDRAENIRMAQIAPGILLQGETPRLLDEWQIAPNLWDSVRFEVDHRGRTGQFVLTGTAVPANRDEIFHSGTGRISWLRMRPMTIFESGESNGNISLRELFGGAAGLAEANSLEIEEIAFLTCRGGWPTASNQTGEIALDRAFDYYDAVVNEDISRVDGVKRSPERAKLLMRSYARNQGSQTSIEAIRRDMLANDTDSLDAKTVQSYIDALKKIFVIEDMPAWNPNLRSKTAIRTTDTRYFIDPSIGTAALGIGPADLINDLETFGLMFETMCIRDLRVYADALDGKVYHYRDKNGLECDAVIHLRNGSYGLIEIKLGGEDAVEYGASTLKKLSSIIDTDKMKGPSFSAVLTGVGRYAYQREDGVYVIPIGCLKD